MESNLPSEVQIGRYQLLDRIAVGGMAEIFLAFERGVAGFQRVVVVKRLRDHLVDDEEVVQMFVKEARIIARLNHPNIVAVHELMDADSRWHIVMEHIEGSTLRELLMAVRGGGQQLPVGVALGIIQQACMGSHHAHELKDPDGIAYNLVHRDISLDNLMVGDTGHVRLLDFGIAKAAAREEKTRQGVLKGKVPYMSPEQCRQEELDRRSDVFSLGIVIWELLAGDRLFKRATEFESLQAVTNAELRRLQDYRGEVPDAVVAVVERALSLNAVDRQQSADALRQELAAVADRLLLDTSSDAIGAVVRRFRGASHQTRREHIEDLLQDQKLETPFTEHVPTDIRRSALPDPTPRRAEEPLPTPEPEPELEIRKRSPVPVVLGVATLGLIGIGAWLFTREPTLPAPTGAPLIVGLAPVMDEQAYRSTHRPVEAWIGAELNRPIEWRFFDSYASLGQAVANDEVPYGLLPPALYVKLADSGVEVVAHKRIDDSTGSDGVVLVMEDGPIGDLTDLMGETICLTDVDSTTGYLLPRLALREAGVDPDTEVSVRLSGNHTQVLRDLNAGSCAAAATYSANWRVADRAGVAVGRMRVLALTGRSPQDTLVAAPSTPPSERFAVQKALLAYQQAPLPDGAMEHITGWDEPAPERFDELRVALERSTEPPQD